MGSHLWSRCDSQRTLMKENVNFDRKEGMQSQQRRKIFVLFTFKNIEHAGT